MLRMQDRASRPGTQRRMATTVSALLLAAAAWCVGSAIAQDGPAQSLSQSQPQPQSTWRVQLPQWPTDLFGATPENVTEVEAPAAVHDPANPDHARLQQPAEAFAAFPADARGKPDWVRALREGAMQPRSTVTDQAPMQLLELDVLMKNTAQMPYVNFPHGAHTQWLTCANCHDALFEPKAGANPTTMPKILAGESCGVCHSKVAFTAMFTCERCHSVPQPGQQRWW
jgi:c(7)-type cytochrome triheme protein